MKKTKLISLSVLSFSTNLTDFEKTTVKGGSWSCRPDLDGDSGYGMCSRLGREFCQEEDEYEDTDVPILCGTRNAGICLAPRFTIETNCTEIQDICPDWF